jgi:hypothetical protein
MCVHLRVPFMKLVGKGGTAQKNQALSFNFTVALRRSALCAMQDP